MNENIEVLKTDDVHVGDSVYAIYYPYDGFLVGRYSLTAAKAVLESERVAPLPNMVGAYIVKYSIERVED